METPGDLYKTALASINSAETLCDLARPFIQAKSRRLVRTKGFTSSDQEEIEQNAYVRLLERFADARAASHLPVLAFIKRVVNQSLANQMRDRLACKRDPRRTTSLSKPLSTGGGTLTELIADEKNSGARQRLLELALDVDEVLSQLEKDQQELCAALGLESISELARKCNRPRSTLQGEVQQLRPKFERGGVNEYLTVSG